MSLQQYGTDGWRVVLYAGKKANGKPRQISRSLPRGIRKAEAKRLAAAIEADMRAELGIERERHGTISELADEWLDLKRTQGCSPITIDNYRHTAKHIKARFGHMPVADLTGRDIDRWYTELVDAGTGQSTIAHNHSILRNMLRQAVKWGQIPSSPTERSSPPRAPKTKINPPTPHAFAAAIAQMPRSSDLKRILEFTAMTGMRRGEVCGLVWGDFGENGTVHVERAVKVPSGQPWRYGPVKTGEERSVRLTRTDVTILAEQRAYLTKAGIEVTLRTPVFPDLLADQSGMTPRMPYWITRQWGAIRDELGLPGVRFHDLRHMNATTMLQAGIPARTVADREGHSKPSITTDTYGHGTTAADLEAVNVLDRDIGALLRPEAIGELE